MNDSGKYRVGLPYQRTLDRHPTAKVDSDFVKVLVHEVKELLPTNHLSKTCKLVGKKYGISEGIVYHIAKGNTWKHVTGLTKPLQSGVEAPFGPSKLTKDEVHAIVARLKKELPYASKNKTYHNIAKDYNVSDITIRHISDGITWKAVTNITVPLSHTHQPPNTKPTVRFKMVTPNFPIPVGAKAYLIVI